MWLPATHPCLPFVLLRGSPSAHSPLLQATPVPHTNNLCKSTSDSPGDGLVNTLASARHNGSWQPQTRQAKINSIAGEVLASHKQMLRHWSLFFQYSTLLSKAWFHPVGRRHTIPRFHGTSWLPLGTGEPSACGQWWNLPIMQNSGT